MPLLTDDETARLSELFERELGGDVTLVHFTERTGGRAAPTAPGDSCLHCSEAEALLGELAATSEHIALEVHDLGAEPDVARRYAIDRAPATVLTGPGARGAVRLFGLPSGYEFATLLEDVIDVSVARDDLSADTRATLDALARDVHLQVFVTPT